MSDSFYSNSTSSAESLVRSLVDTTTTDGFYSGASDFDTESSYYADETSPHHVHISADITDAASANTASTIVKRDASGNFSAGTITAALTGNASTATKLATTRTISATGDATGSASFDGSANAAIALTLAASGVVAGSYGSATTIPTFTVDATGRITAVSTVGAASSLVTSVAGRTGDIVLAIADVSGLQSALDGKQASGSYAAAVHTHISADITDATSANTASMIVKRDASGNFSAGTITAALAGNASTSTKLATARTISATGDATGSASFDGSANAAIALTLADTPVINGTYGATENYIPRFDVDTKGRITFATDIPIVGYYRVDVATTAAITLSGTQTIDGVALVENDRVLVKNQSTSSQNGIYTVATGGWLRAGDFDAVATMTTPIIAVKNGTSNGGKLFTARYKSSSVVGTTSFSVLEIMSNTGTYSISTTGSAAKITTARTISTSGDATGSVSFDGSANVDIALTLAASGATAGTYGSATVVPVITVDAKGRITSASNTAITFPVSSVAGKTGAVTLAIADVSGLQSALDGKQASGSYAAAVHTHASADITDATNLNTASMIVKRDASGNFSAGTITAALTGNASTATKLATARTISATGDATGSASFDGSANAAIALTLAASGATAGTYGSATVVPVITVDAKGRITYVSTATISGGGSGITALTGDVTASGTGSVAATLAASGVTAGTYTKLTVDSKGRATAGATLTSSDLPASPTITAAPLVLTNTSGNAAIEFGRQDGTASTPYIDFHSAATASDYDSRIMASGGNGTAGSGTLNFYAATFAYNGDLSITGGVNTTNDADGTFSSGTYTPTPVGGNIKSITNGGAFTFAAPSVSGVYTIVVEITNSATAGAVTFSGFAKMTGDSLTTTSGSKFQVFIAKTNGGTTGTVVAMQ